MAVGLARWCWLAPWVGLAAGVLNVNFLLEWALPHRTPIALTVVSDLAAPERAWHWAFRLGDAGSSVLLLVLCALAWAVAGRGARAWRVGTLGLALFAATTLFAVLVPEQCTATSVPPCPPNVLDKGLGDLLHDVMSSLGTTCGIFAALAFAVATRGARREAWAHLAAFLVAGGLGLFFIFAQVGGHDAWLGWPQRAQIVVLSAWYVVVGHSVRTRAAASSPDHRPAKMAP